MENDGTDRGSEVLKEVHQNLHQELEAESPSSTPSLEKEHLKKDMPDFSAEESSVLFAKGEDGGESVHRIYQEGKIVEIPVSELSTSQKRKLRKYLEKKKQHKLSRANKQKKRKCTQVARNATRRELKNKEFNTGDLSIVVDLQFESMMTSKEITSLSQQISRLYSVNRRAEHPIRLTLSSLGGLTEKHMTKSQYQNWRGVECKKEHFSEFIEKEKVVYLTSESPNVMDEVHPDEFYIIGGLVDHNRYKSFTHEYAEKNGFRHAQLPIGEYVRLASRKVLTINQVFEILLYYMECKNWEEAFLRVIPKRKGVKAKSKAKSNISANSKEEISKKAHATKIPSSDAARANIHAGDEGGVINAKESTTEEEHT